MASTLYNNLMQIKTDLKQAEVYIKAIINHTEPRTWYTTTDMVHMWDAQYNLGLESQHSTSTSTITDLIGNVNLNINGTKTWYDKYLSYGTSSYVMSNSNIAFPQSCTIEMYAKWSSPKSNCYPLTVGSYQGFGLSQYDGSKARYHQGGNGRGNFNFSMATPSLLSFVKDTSSTRLYINGILQGTINYTMDTYTAKLCFSTENGGGSITRVAQDIYNIRTYDKALTQEEILSNYEIDIQRF